MAFGKVEYGEMLAEGKTKIIYAHPQSPISYTWFTKTASPRGWRPARYIARQGAIACRTTSNVFYLLEYEGVPTHYIGMVADNANIVMRCTMIPLEVVMRRIATGSYLKRHPEVAEGTRFEPTVVEMFYKDDANHDPLVTDEEIRRMGVATQEEIATMRDIGRQVFLILEKAWAAQDVTLVDLKIEFGRSVDGQLLVADVIDNDSWRIWPQGEKAQMLDKQIYRDMPDVTDEHLRALLSKYRQVADLTDRFIEED